MPSSELEAREAIRDVIARYAHAADTGRFEELVTLFAEDGRLEIDGLPALHGRAAILDFLRQRKLPATPEAAGRFIRHHVSSVRIELSSHDAATAKSYFLAITERGPDHWGVYRDRFVRSGERWLFQVRRVKVDGRARAE
ncbi:MAG TPA: nuclear transport factor 2 family protein [Candidatus Binatia bacterium]|nr:nuclear transport factor 2 family protein [Candidatus Binatia bacterium]